jgi:hypothetical protein
MTQYQTITLIKTELLRNELRRLLWLLLGCRV